MEDREVCSLKGKNEILHHKLVRWKAWHDSTYPRAYFLAERMVEGDSTLASVIARDALTLTFLGHQKRKLLSEAVSLEALEPFVAAAWIDIAAPSGNDIPLEEMTRSDLEALANLTEDDIDERLDELVPEFRDIVRRLLGGATLVEIAKSLHVGVASLRVRVHRFRKMMKEQSR